MRIHPRFLPYGVAFCSTAIALLLSLWLEAFLSQTIGEFFYIAIMVTAWYGGFQVGSVTVVLSTLALDFFFLPPLHQLGIGSARDMLRLGIFLLVALVINLLTSNFQQRKKKIRQLSQQLIYENAELLHKQVEQQRLVMEINQRIHQSLKLQDILQTTVGEVRRFLQCDRVIIFQFSPGWIGNVVVESVDSNWTAILSTQIYDPCFSENYIEPFKQGLFTAKSDIYTAGIGTCHLELLANFQVRANLVIPILQGEELWGLLIAHHCAAPREWQPSEIELMRQLAIQAGIAIKQASLFEQVQTELRERKQAETALQQINTELEQRVAERTLELTKVNDSLVVTILLKEQAYQLLNEQAQLLHQSESTLRSFFNSASMQMGIVEIYPNDIFHLSSNIATAQFFGTTSEAMQNRFASEIGVPQAFIEIWLDYYRETERTGAPVKFEYQHQTAKTQKWLSVTTCSIISSPSGRSRFSFIVEDITERKRTEQMLELQAVITRNMAEGICLVRADNGVIVYANPKFEQMFGYDDGELNGHHVSIVNYSNEFVSAEEVNQGIQTAVLQSGEFSYEVHTVKKDGTPFWCSATCSVFKHSDYGDVLVAVQQDITERKQAEEALLQKARKEELIRSITQTIRQSLDLSTILNSAVTEVRQTLQSDRAAIYRFNVDWSGNFVAESVGEDWVKLVGADIQKVWEDTYLQETQGGCLRNNEIFAVADIYRADLQLCHIELLEQFQAKSYAVFPIFSGANLWGLLAIYQNATPRQWQFWEIELVQQITNQLALAIQQSELYEKLQLELQERKQAEATIREAERRWRSLLDNVQLIVVGLDRWGNVNYVNTFFLKMTGYTNSEVLGKNWFENFLPRSDRQSIQTVFSEVLTENAHPYYQNAILTKFGDCRLIAWNNTMLQDIKGNIIGTISIGEDITERQKIEQIKDEFISIVSHELRTPLTAIQMSLGLLKTGIYDNKPDKFRRMIEIALLDTNRLVNLVNDILDLERLDSGRVVLEKTICKVADLMQQAVDGIQAIAAQHQISLIVAPTNLKVWAAPDAIIQTLINLLSNAIKFSPAQSTIHLSTVDRKDFVLFQVRDRGRGIPADKLELIFGRFQQVDASDSREKGGTGLGLAICRSIIERHGGKIWAESILGEGSTFFFTLPLPQLENLL
ncbi:MAG TPA: PAS domain S-box protein [Kamptonema sp.]|nr:PAS domain S-box protein [Kamptonema sp.]